MYREELEDGGVHIIPKDHISLQSKIALGKPYSGDVYNAQWTQDDNTKVVCEGVFLFSFQHTRKPLHIHAMAIWSSIFRLV